MKFNVIKTATKLFGKSKSTIIKHGPQIMAVAGAVCFIGATVCAVKETPKAMEKLEEKKAIDPDMTTLQKAAVIVPEYKKTIGMSILGVGLTAGAWHLVNGRMAALSTMLATAVKDKESLIEASKEVVGEEKTGEILAKHEEIKEDELETAANGVFDMDDVPYLFKFPNGTRKWMTWADFKRCNANAVDEAAQSKGLKLSDYFRKFGLKECEITSEMEERGWQPEPGAWALCENSKDWYQWASEIGEYTPEAFTYDKYRHLSGWSIEWGTSPQKWRSDYTGY